MLATKKLLILDLTGVFFYYASTRTRWNYDLTNCYNEVGRKKDEIIFADPDMFAFFDQLLAVPALTIMIWSSKSDDNIRAMLNVLRPPQNIKLIGRDMCKKNPAIGRYAVSKRLDDIWNSAGFNEDGTWNQSNTVIVDDTITKIDCNPAHNTVHCTPINVNEYRGSDYLCKTLFMKIMARFDEASAYSQDSSSKQINK
jgi:hypothetical protein